MKTARPSKLKILHQTEAINMRRLSANEETMEHSIDQYVRFLEQVAGVDAECHLITERDEVPPVWSIAFQDTPEPGSLTGFTYGLSSFAHPGWVRGRPELVINVNSRNIDWCLAIGFLVKRFQGVCPFSYGNVLRFGGPVSDESTMSAFLIFIPTILDRGQAHIELGDRTINVVQAYPIYEEEIQLIETNGAETFFMRDSIDFCDIRRPNSGLRRTKS